MMKLNVSDNTPEWIPNYLRELLAIYQLEHFKITVTYIEKDDSDYEADKYAEIVPSSDYHRCQFIFYDCDDFKTRTEEGESLIEHEVLELFFDYNILSLVVTVLLYVDPTGVLFSLVQKQKERLIEHTIAARKGQNAKNN